MKQDNREQAMKTNNKLKIRNLLLSMMRKAVYFPKDNTYRFSDVDFNNLFKEIERTGLILSKNSRKENEQI